MKQAGTMIKTVVTESPGVTTSNSICVSSSGCTAAKGTRAVSRHGTIYCK
ncbi:hypothetical protein ABE137_08920 [Brevibacillus laterosporus]|nr:hypothetical protein [Brevibacillus halotolerans]